MPRHLILLGIATLFCLWVVGQPDSALADARAKVASLQAAVADLSASSQQHMERQLVKLIEGLPLEEADKNLWIDRIRNGEMSQELADEVREKITGLGEEDERAQTNRARYLTELSMIVKRWRLSSQSSNFRSAKR